MRRIVLLSCLLLGCATAPAPRVPTFSFPVPEHAKSKAWVCVRADNGIDLECVDMEQFLTWASERHLRQGLNENRPDTRQREM